ncbi:MAG: phosphatidate cytidylyltransferase [Clostridia bacterium]|nr:phosphatidate cytidylyltransferase [Clostridia bacterium]
MKQRVITGVGIAIFLVGWLFSIFTWGFPVLTALLAVLSAFEIHKVAGVKNIPLTVISMCVAGVIPLAAGSERFQAVPALSKTLALIWKNPFLFGIAYVLLALILMLALYKKTRFEHVAMSLFAGVAVPMGYASLVLLSSLWVSGSRIANLFFVMLSFSCAWVTDIFALFTGKAFGKHKLSPNISPKKTVEGAIGGIVCTMLINLLLLFIFRKIAPNESFAPYFAIAMISIVLSAAGMCGDLSASVIKRNYGVKDFSNLLPGHGGIMDRFDSCLFVWPCLCVICKLAAMIAEEYI